MFITDAYAAAEAAPTLIESGSLSGTLIQLALILLIFYFLLIRPMKKREQAHNAMVEALKVGDKVITNGGIYGTVSKIDGMRISLEVAPNMNIDFDRMAISGVLPKEDKKADGAKAKKQNNKNKGTK
jgi:preprotein translocase subunit YajC